MKTESEFIKLLEERAREQRRVVESGVMPEWAKGFGSWLGVNPWRVLVPLSLILYLFLRVYLGEDFRELILSLFGGFRR